uniref:Uncharacterized protein n=1 Tax=Anguilla anguilla TaxID=7936 RepID=A0A0E9SXL4_ANGAN
MSSNASLYRPVCRLKTSGESILSSPTVPDSLSEEMQRPASPADSSALRTFPIHRRLNSHSVGKLCK